MKAALVAAALLLAAAPARADDARLEAAADYFDGELRGAWTLIAMGAGGLGGGAVLATRDDELSQGIGYPLLGIGVVHVAAGVFVHVASRRRRTTIDRLNDLDDEELAEVDRWHATEQARMRGVSRQFTALKIVEVVLVGAGLATAAIASRRDEPLVVGVGLGVAVEAAATLAFDVVAARRAKRYRRGLAE